MYQAEVFGLFLKHIQRMLASCVRNETNYISENQLDSLCSVFNRYNWRARKRDVEPKQYICKGRHYWHVKKISTYTTV